MPSLFEPAARAALLERAGRLTPQHPARWGRLTASGMLAHVNDAMRMAFGELTVAPKHLPLRYPPLKQLVIYFLPFPHGAPTAPELLTRAGGAVWDEERAAFPALIEQFGGRAGVTAWPDHPAFGALSARGWAVLQCRHLDHHFRQFGV